MATHTYPFAASIDRGLSLFLSRDVNFSVRRFLPLFLSLLGAFTPFASGQTAVQQALTTFDSAVRDYNVITLTNLTLNGTHTDGGVAVGSNFTVGNSVIAMQTNAGTNPALYVNGQIDLTANSQFNNGYASTPNLSNALTWTYNPSNNQYQRGLTDGCYTLSYNTSNAQAYTNPRNVAGPSGWNWATLQSDIVSASATLAAATATGTIGISGQNLTFSSSASGVVVFNLDASKIVNGIYDLNGDNCYDQNTERISNIQLNLAADQYFVVNLRNATSDNGCFTLFDGVSNFNSGTNNTQLLWNIIPDNNECTADILSLGTNLYGSVLAPLVDIQSNYHYLNGQILAQSLTQTGAEIHTLSYQAPVTFSPVPEPSTYAALASALCAVGFFWQRSRRRVSSPRQA